MSVVKDQQRRDAEELGAAELGREPRVEKAHTRAVGVGVVEHGEEAEEDRHLQEERQARALRENLKRRKAFKENSPEGGGVP